MTESEAQAVARVLGGDAWNSGGGIELVVIERPDGRVVAVSDEAVPTNRPSPAPPRTARTWNDIVTDPSPKSGPHFTL